MPVILGKVEMSPCIVSKAKYALGLKTNKPHNNKKCSEHYWIKVINYLGEQNELQHNIIEAARNREDLFR